MKQNNFFTLNDNRATLTLNPRWMHLEPMALAMIAAWGAWCKRQGLEISVEHLSKQADYAARMKLFEHLGVDYQPHIVEHEEIGRFIPLRNIRTPTDVRGMIADVSALLHLDQDQEALAAVRYCTSELLRNVLEHSGSPDGAYVCAHNYSETEPYRVTIAVADCGRGITDHLGYKYPQVANNHLAALRHAMQPGITGVLPGVYGTPDNAGAGLFITRCMAKGTGGYFLIISGNAAYRLMRARQSDEHIDLHTDPFDDRCALWEFDQYWQGTVVSLEIRRDMIADFEGFFGWIRKYMPAPISVKEKIRFS